MRASRLLTITMMLQTRGRMSAEALSEELEVSVRTIYRDIDQLSASGVPVYAETGRNGGFALLDGWRTRLTGLTPPEAQAMFLTGLPGPAGQLGLGEAAASAELKLLAALPDTFRSEAQRISARFHLDPSGWFHPGETSTFLQTIASAVWAEQKLDMTYESWTRTADRIVEPLGIVLKSGMWYLVARRDGVVRTYRVAMIRRLELLDEHFERPVEFDLAAFWEQSIKRFDQDLNYREARLLVSSLGAERVKNTSAAWRNALEQTPPDFSSGEWEEISVPTGDTAWAIRDFTHLGAEAIVLAPEDLREAMRDVAIRLASLYHDHAAVDSHEPRGLGKVAQKGSSGQ